MNREPHFDENEVLRQCMSPLNEEVPDMPENFHAQWTALVKEDAMKQEETRKVAPMRRWTRILSVAAALVFVVGGTLLTKDSLSPARTSAPQSPRGRVRCSPPRRTTTTFTTPTPATSAIRKKPAAVYAR